MHSIPIRAFLISVVAIRQSELGHEVLLLKRTQTLVGEWCQVAGKIEAEETAWQAALRELNEETKLTPTSLFSADINEQFYEAGRDAITVAPVFAAVINSTDTVSLNHEHSEYRWVSFDDAIEMVAFGGQRRILRWIEDEFVKRQPCKHLLIQTEEAAAC
ncbi:NUDIX hydrolase [Pseudovibrio japonicus]|uniref:NUDIX hydrolase n=1 Tax=Pseudovibrio japonicus TaxID=366534 RepID=A0ABQ3DVK9_9HYPH|nr:NUDIX domain-containing protein [Pseudovibrio japonicus]GHB16758.1 NUDIX hydrolase [Pseudovibrio japonicus]